MLKTYFTKLRTTLLLALLSVVTMNAWGETKDVINRDLTKEVLGSTGTTSWHDIFSQTFESGAVYTIKSMGTKDGTQALQWNTKGFLYMTKSGGVIESVSVTGTSGKSVNLFASKTAYTQPPTTNTGAISMSLTGQSVTHTFAAGDDYQYICIKGAASSTQIAEITITYRASDKTATTTTIDATGITNTDVHAGAEAGKLTATVSADGTAVEGATVTWSSSDPDVATIDGEGNVTLVAAGTTTLTAIYAGNDTYAPSSATYTLNVTDSTPATDIWVETNLTELTADDIFVIVGQNAEGYYAMTNNNGASSAPVAAAVTVVDGEITSSVANNIKWNVSGNAINGYTFYPNGETETWLYCTNSNNGVRVGTNDDKTFKVSGGYLQHEGTSRFVGVYNSQDWRCYTSSSATNIAGQSFSFYKKVNANEVIIMADNVDIAYDATSGSISYSIKNAAEGATLSATTLADWLTIGTVGETIPFTCTVNELGTARTATVTLACGEVTKEVIVTQAGDPTAPITIAEARAQATGSVITKGIVTSCVGTTAYIQDETAAICVYGKQNLNLAVGDEIRVSGSLTTFHGLLEIQNPDVVVISEGNTVTPAVKTVGEITDDIQGQLVKIENAVVTEIGENNVTTVAQGDNTVAIHSSEIAYPVGTKLTLTGNVGCYDAVQIVNPTDIEATYTRTVTAGNYGTICLPYATLATSGADFFTVSGKVMNGEELQSIALEPVEGQLEAGKPYIFKATASELTATLTGAAVTVPVAGALIGTFVNTTAPMGSYVLSQNQLYVVDSEVTIAANRAYIDITEIPVASGEVKGVTLGVGNATGIHQAPALSEGEAVIYDLQGRRVTNPTKGLFIVNGKKVLK